MNKTQIVTTCLVTIPLVPGIVLAQNIDTSIPNKLESEIEPKDNSIGPVGNTGDMELMDSIIKDYKEELEIENDQNDIEYLENTLYRLEIAKAIILVSRNSSDVDEPYQEKTIEELFILLDATYGPEDFVSSDDNSRTTRVDLAVDNTINTIHKMSHGPSIDVNRVNNHHQTHYDCKHKRTVTGTASSTLISYTNGKAKITGTFSYPSEINEKITDRRNHQCLEFEHTKVVKRHDVIANLIPGADHVKAQVCTLVATSPSDTDEDGVMHLDQADSH